MASWSGVGTSRKPLQQDLQNQSDIILNMFDMSKSNWKSESPSYVLVTVSIYFFVVVVTEASMSKNGSMCQHLQNQQLKATKATFSAFVKELPKVLSHWKKWCSTAVRLDHDPSWSHRPHCKSRPKWGTDLRGDINQDVSVQRCTCTWLMHQWGEPWIQGLSWHVLSKGKELAPCQTMSGCHMDHGHKW